MALQRPLPANVLAAMRQKLREAPGVGANVEEQSLRIRQSLYKDFLDALSQLRGDPEFQIWFTATAPVAALDSTINIVAAAPSVQVLPQRVNRQYLMIVNTGANSMRVAFGKPAGANTGILLPVNGFYEPSRPISSSVNLFSTAGTEAVTVEG